MAVDSSRYPNMEHLEGEHREHPELDICSGCRVDSVLAMYGLEHIKVDGFASYQPIGKG